MTAEDISDILENENCVTVRWIALHSGITLPEAEKLTLKYQQDHKSKIKANYLISGVNESGLKSFLVSNEDNLNATKAKFQKITSQQIYSIQKSSESSLTRQLSTLDTDQAVDMLLMKHPHCGKFLKNSYGGIHLAGLDVKPVGERVLSAHYEDNSIKAPANIKTETAEEHMSRMFANKSSAPAKSKSSVLASSYFNSVSKDVAPAKPKPKTDVPKEKSKSPFDVVESQRSTTPVAARADSTVSTLADDVSMKADDDDDDAEWDDGTGYKVDTARLAKRSLSDIKKSIPSDEEDEEGVEVDNDDSGGDVGAKKGSKNKKKKHIHGAMDDYMEDVAIADFKSHQDPGDGTKVRRTKKKQVEKTFVDEKGYLVTEMVYEEVTDDEADYVSSVPVKKHEDNNGMLMVTKKGAPAASAKPAAASKGGKKDDKTSSGPPQKNMMSFFGKK